MESRGKEIDLTTSTADLDYDCDFLIDYEEEDGFKEVLHMLCSTPRVGPVSPRYGSSNTPRKILLPTISSIIAAPSTSPLKAIPVYGTEPLITSPQKKAIDDSNLKFLSQFNDSSINHLLNVLASSQSMQAPNTSSITGNFASSSSEIAAPELTLPTRAVPLSTTGVRPGQQYESSKIKVITRKRSITDAQIISASASGTGGLKRLQSSYDIDLTPESINERQNKGCSPRNNVQKSADDGMIPAIAPLSYLLAQPSLANMSAPLPCPFNAAAVKHGLKQDKKKSIGLASGDQDSSGDKSSRCEDAGAPGSRKQKSLHFLCKKFISRCAMLSQLPVSNDVVVSIADLATYLQITNRRAGDIVNILAAVKILTPTHQRPKGQYIYCDPANIQSFLGQVQEDAIRKYPSQAVSSGLLRSEEEEKAQDFRTVVSKGSRAKPPVQESLCIGLIGLFLSGFDNLSLHEASKHLPSCFSSEKSRNEVSTVTESTKMKRLYDVANTLCGAGILGKESCQESPSTSMAATIKYHWSYPVTSLAIRRAFKKCSV